MLPEQIHQQFATNVYGVMNVTRAGPTRRNGEQDGAGHHVFLRSPDWAEDEGQANSESADQASCDDPADVTCLHDHPQITSDRCE